MSRLSRKALGGFDGHRRLHAVLIALGAAIALMGLTAATVASDQLNHSFRRVDVSSAPPDIELITSPASPSLERALKDIPNVQAVVREVYTPALWKTPTGPKKLEIIGTANFHRQRLGRFALVRGTAPTRGQMAVESSDGSLGPLAVGSRLLIEVGSSRRFLSVSGVSRTTGQPVPDLSGHGLAYMSIGGAEAAFPAATHDLYLIKLRHYAQRDTTAKIIARAVHAYHAFVVASQIGKDVSGPQIADGLVADVRAASILALIIYALLLAATVRVTLAYQTTYFHVMTVMGASRSQIVLSCLGGIARLVVGGAVLGVLLGLLAADVLVRYVSDLFTLPVNRLSVPLTDLAFALATAIGVSLVAAFLPVWLVGRRNVERQWPGQMRLGPLAHAALPLAVRAILRELLQDRRHRWMPGGLPVLVVLSIGGATFLSASLTKQSLDRLVGGTASAYRADVVVSFSQPQDFRAVRAVARSTPGGDDVERYFRGRVTTQWGPAQLDGVERSSRLYGRDLISGRWFYPNENGAAVISEDGANRSGLALGDSIAFHDDLHSARWRVIGILRRGDGIAEGAGAFGAIVAPIDSVTGFQGLPASSAQALMIRSKDPATTPASLARRIRAGFGAAGYQVDVQTASDYEDRIRSQISSIYAGLYGATLICAVGCGIWFLTVLTLWVIARRPSIGVLRAIGATSRDIAQTMWSAATVVGLLAWPAAAALGVLAAQVAVATLRRLAVPVSPSFSAGALLSLLLFMMILCALASVVPIWMAVRMAAHKTMRCEARDDPMGSR
jgi:ABC-type antimicrobial peptide transport system permease subunit